MSNLMIRTNFHKYVARKGCRSNSNSIFLFITSYIRVRLERWRCSNTQLRCFQETILAWGGINEGRDSCVTSGSPRGRELEIRESANDRPLSHPNMQPGSKVCSSTMLFQAAFKFSVGGVAEKTKVFFTFPYIAQDDRCKIREARICLQSLGSSL
jgi:hypothetical protein